MRWVRIKGMKAFGLDPRHTWKLIAASVSSLHSVMFFSSRYKAIELQKFNVHMEQVGGIFVVASIFLWTLILLQIRRNRDLLNQVNDRSSQFADAIKEDRSAENSPTVEANIEANYSWPRRHHDGTYQVDEYEPLPFEQLDTATCTAKGRKSLRERLLHEEKILKSKPQVRITMPNPCHLNSRNRPHGPR